MAESRKRKKKKQQQRLMLLGSAAVLVVVVIVVACVKLFGGNETKLPDESDTAPVSESETVNQNRNPLTGEPDYTGDGSRPVVFMINNASAARPQWGLCSPDIVFEGLVEGGASRMMWAYANAQEVPEKVGSMRSARHDFVELAQGLDAVLVHWGGSNFAYDAIKNEKVAHIDGKVYLDKYFYRDAARRSQGVAIEHTGYAKGSSIRKALGDLEIRTAVKDGYTSPFRFGSPDAPRVPAGGACSSITVSYSGDYAHTFRYEPDAGVYANYMNDKPMTQDGGEQMKVHNVLVLYCGITDMGTTEGHIDMDLNGGSGLYLSQGGYEQITWKKGASTQALKLYGADGKELVLNTGKSWIGLIPSSRQSKTVMA